MIVARICSYRAFAATLGLATAVAAIGSVAVDGPSVAKPAGATDAARSGDQAISIAAGRAFWSFRPLQRSLPPAVNDRLWPQQRIDMYVLAALEAVGRAPAASAERRTLIRRVTFDLIGLPPTPEEVEAFVGDDGPEAYARLVERLLASPHYGERWGRYWLDLVRYCDVPESWAKSNAQAWLYRDWVVQAINQDLPYDQFVMRQFAADQMAECEPADVAALGFLGLSPSYWKELKLAPDVIKMVVAEEWEERIDAVSSTMLGLTVACARCHDHKFEPITQHDYYGLAGVFASTRQVARPILPPEDATRVLAALREVEQLDGEGKKLTDELKKLEAEQKKAEAERTQAPEDEALRAKAESIAAKIAETKQNAETAAARATEIRRTTPQFDSPLAYAIEDASLDVLADGPSRTKLEYRTGEGQDVAVQMRGNPTTLGPVAPRRFLAVLAAEPRQFTQGSGRLELAQAIFRDAAPLAARVMVNRVWQHHFGRGIVETPSNFGTQGARPSHRELLNDLAARFIESGWSLKWLHREIVLSATYQQASQVDGAANVDPDNRLFGRTSRRRLEVEPWRDAMLGAAGTLDRRVGGADVELNDATNNRRTLYGTVRRRELADLLRLYDCPDATAHLPARIDTTTPLQQLYVLNSEFIGRQAVAMAARVRDEHPGNLPAQVRRAYALLFGRGPSERELTLAEWFLAPAGTDEPAFDRWQQYVEVLLASNELMFLD
jgi:hypothetical protein